MRPSERIAQSIVEAVLDGSRMAFNSKQSKGEPDFTLTLRNGDGAVLEVTEAVDANAVETHAAILGRRAGGSRVRAKLCQRTWYIRPSPAPNINRLRTAVEKPLADLEAAKIHSFFSSTDRHTHPATEYLYTFLGVTGGEVLDSLEAGFIHLALPITGGAIGAQNVNDAVELEAWKPDNRAKLAATSRPERHLFVFVDVRNAQVWLPLTQFTPPTAPPNLPPEITHAWVAGPSGADNTFVVWHATRGVGWGVLDPISVRVRSASASD